MLTAKSYQLDTSHMPGQKRFMESQAEWLLYSGAFGAGKSRIGCEKGLFLSLKYPNNFGAILRKTFASLRHTTMRTMFRSVCHPDYIQSYNKETHILRLVNGSEILFIGLDTDTKIGSLELGWAFVDEVIEVEEDIWIMLDGRVGRLTHIPFSQLMAATNPASSSHWAYKYFFLEKDPSREVIQANSLENPYLSGEYRSKLEKYTGRYRQRYVLGQWVGYEGLVYDNVDVQEVLVPRFRVPGHWRRYRAIDFGYSNPFVCQWWAEVPPEDEYEPIEAVEQNSDALVDLCPCPEEDTFGELSAYHYSRCLNNPLKGWYLYRELYMSRRIVEIHGNMIYHFSQGENIIETFADWDAEGRATLETTGVLTSPARKSIAQGIQVCYKLFDQNRIHFMENSLIEKDEAMEEAGSLPLMSIQELGNYRWMELPHNKNNKEVPQDRDNHGMDAMRYLFDTLIGDTILLKDTYYAVSNGPIANQKSDRSLNIQPRNWSHNLAPTRDWRRLRF